MKSFANDKPAIALIPDVRDWAFSNIATQIQKNLGDRYSVTLFYRGDYSSFDRLYADLFENRHDIVHFFWRNDVLDLFNFLNHSSTNRNRDYILPFVKTRITFSIYDHLFQEKSDLEVRSCLFNDIVVDYTVSSNKLNEFYSHSENIRAPGAVIEDGVDPDYFYPMDLERLSRDSRDIVVGWVGNSIWYQSTGIDQKGLHTIIKPAIEELRQEGFAVTSLFADRNERFISFSEMVDYYKSIDIYVCASNIEGTPNPILESMACGVPVISTDVGIVPQVFGPLQSDFIFRERTKEALKEKLKILIRDAKLRVALSKENLRQIKDWTRLNESRKWDRFFSKVLQSTPDSDEKLDTLFPGQFREKSRNNILDKLKRLLRL